MGLGGGYSEDHTIQMDLVLTQITEIRVARVVLREGEGPPWYREEGIRLRFPRWWDPEGSLVVPPLRLVA